MGPRRQGQLDLHLAARAQHDGQCHPPRVQQSQSKSNCGRVAESGLDADVPTDKQSSRVQINYVGSNSQLPL